MAPKKNTLVSRPEDDADFRALVEERQKLLEQREQNGREWADLRARIDHLGGEMSVRDNSTSGWKEARAAQQKAYERLAAIEEQNASAKRRLREISDQLPLTRQKAAAKLAGTVSDSARPAVRDYLAMRTKTEAASLVAAATLFPLSDACAARRVPLRPQLPDDLNRRKGELTQLRADTLAALDNGTLQKRDLPREVLEAWGLR